VSSARERVERCVRAAARIADANDALGREARAVLPDATGLSPENVELGLIECLESAPSEAEICELCESAEPAPAAHVLLSANVFVAAHRAIALGLAASERVTVRCSRREPHMTRLLLSGGAPFELADELAPAAGHHVFAYGRDATLAQVRQTIPRGVVLHEHGSGLGVALVDGEASVEAAARALAADIVPFDQRGCLSPRLALVAGAPDRARLFCEALTAALAEWEKRVPRGVLSAEELAEEARYRDAAAYSMELFEAGSAAVSFAAELDRAALIAPIGRNIHVGCVSDPAPVLEPLLPWLTALGISGSSELAGYASRLAPGARMSSLGSMQRPRFDGPVDRRSRAQSRDAASKDRSAANPSNGTRILGSPKNT
jgi:hypothetical protein